MNNQLKKGVLELAILGILDKEELYGYLIIQKLEPYVKVKESSVYILLSRLKQNGYVDERLDLNGKRKVYYLKLNDSGREYKKQLEQQWHELKILIEETVGDCNE